jgi:hypothetical protein
LERSRQQVFVRSHHLLLLQSLTPPCHSSISSDSISQIARLLKKPKLIRGLNAILSDGYRIDCSADGDEVEFFTLSTPTGAEILSPDASVRVPKPASTWELRAFVCRPEYTWKDVTFPTDHCQTPQWLGCVSQLAQRVRLVCLVWLFSIRLLIVHIDFRSLRIEI